MKKKQDQQTRRIERRAFIRQASAGTLIVVLGGGIYRWKFSYPESASADS